MKTISSLTNPEVKLVTQLHTKKGRKEQSCFIAQGIRIIQTMIELGSLPIKLYVTEPELNILPPELKTLNPKDLPRPEDYCRQSSAYPQG